MKLEKCKCGLTNWGLKNTPLTQYLYCLCCSTPYPDRTEELVKSKIKLTETLNSFVNKNEELEKELERINNISEQRKHIEAKYELAIKEVERLEKLLAGMRADNALTRSDVKHYIELLSKEEKENEELENKVDDFEEKIHKITNWIKAYPLKIFPSMSIDDWKSVRDILSSNGYTIDRISADNMRHVLNGIHKILSGEGEVK